jgi:hypothetical protein
MEQALAGLTWRSKERSSQKGQTTYCAAARRLDFKTIAGLFLLLVAE